MNGKLARAIRRWSALEIRRLDGVTRRLTTSEERDIKRHRRGMSHRDAGKGRLDMDLFTLRRKP